MEVHTNADIRPHGITHSGHVGQRQVDLVESVEKLQLFGAIHLHRRKTALHRVLGGARRIGGPITANPRVDANLVTHLTAEQVTDRHPQRLALDVPQRLIDAGQRTHVNRAAAVETAAVQHGPDVFDVARVFADQVIGQLFHSGSDRVRAAFDHWLAPADNALVSLDLEEAPARRNDERGEFGDFHECSFSC